MYNQSFGPFIFIPYQEYKEEYRASPDYKNEKIRPIDVKPVLFSPEEALVHGNDFKDIYVPYKNYTPMLNRPNDDRQYLLLQIAIYAHFAHDLNLYLDIYPENKALFELFKEYSKKTDEAKKDYEKKYGPLAAKDATYVDNRFSYIYSPSPWMM